MILGLFVQEYQLELDEQAFRECMEEQAREQAKKILNKQIWTRKEEKNKNGKKRMITLILQIGKMNPWKKHL